MKTAYVFLANGFEEIEALAPVDLMRRAGITVHTVGVNSPMPTGSHDITVTADIDGGSFTLPTDADIVVLPGGAGVDNLLRSDMVAGVLKEAEKRGILVGAICAAPAVLLHSGLLAGKTATAFPGTQPVLREAGVNVTGRAVEQDGNIITARSAGVALQFGHALISALLNKQAADSTLAAVYPGE